MGELDYILYNPHVKWYFLLFFNIFNLQKMFYKIKKTGTPPCTCKFRVKLSAFSF